MDSIVPLSLQFGLAASALINALIFGIIYYFSKEIHRIRLIISLIVLTLLFSVGFYYMFMNQLDNGGIFIYVK